MKLVIPSEIDLFPQSNLSFEDGVSIKSWKPLIYKIRWSDRMDDDTDGQIDFNKRIIRLRRNEDANAMFYCLIHELEHLTRAICTRRPQWLWRILLNEEKTVSITSYIRCSILLSLGIEPDFSQIPEEEDNV